MLGALFGFDREMPFPGAAPLLPCAGAALLLYSGKDGHGPVVQLLSIPPLGFVGRISYSLYLWHWVEQPFRKRSVIFGKKMFLAAAAMGILVFGVGGLLVAASSGWSSRFAGIDSVSMDKQVYEEARDLEWTRFNEANCFVDDIETWRAEACFLRQDGTKRVLLWGDSFAASYAYGFFRIKGSGVNVLEYTSPQCPPLIGYDAASRPQCRQFNNAVREIVKRHHIATVIMAANWSAYIKRRKLQISDIEKTVEYLHSLPVRVVLVGQSPVFDFAYPDDYFFEVYGTQNDDRSYYAPPDLHAKINTDMEAATRPDAFFDPLAFWCVKAGCLFRRGSSYLYSDYGHFTHTVSVFAVTALLKAPHLWQ